MAEPAPHPRHPEEANVESLGALIGRAIDAARGEPAPTLLDAPSALPTEAGGEAALALPAPLLEALQEGDALLQKLTAPDERVEPGSAALAGVRLAILLAAHGQARPPEPDVVDPNDPQGVRVTAPGLRASRPTKPRVLLGA